MDDLDTKGAIATVEDWLCIARNAPTTAGGVIYRPPVCGTEFRAIEQLIALARRDGVSDADAAMPVAGNTDGVAVGSAAHPAPTAPGDVVRRYANEHAGQGSWFHARLMELAALLDRPPSRQPDAAATPSTTELSKNLGELKSAPSTAEDACMAGGADNWKLDYNAVVGVSAYLQEKGLLNSARAVERMLSRAASYRNCQDAHRALAALRTPADPRPDPVEALREAREDLEAIANGPVDDGFWLKEVARQALAKINAVMGEAG